jgi:hypothetical protein
MPSGLLFGHFQTVYDCYGTYVGATTHSIMAFSIMTLSIMAFSIMTLSIMTFRVTTLSIRF